MLEEFEYTGKWWVPGNESEEFHGTLKLVPNERPLLLITDLSRTSSPRIRNPLEIMSGVSSCHEIILGRCHDGRQFKDITLYKCTQFHSNIDVVTKENAGYFSPKVIFVGAHFQKAEQIRFKSITLHYSHVNEWLRMSEFARISEIIDGPGTHKSKILEVLLSEDCKLVIDNVITVSGRSLAGQRELTIVERPYITIEALEEAPVFSEYQKIELYVRFFLSLWISEAIYPLSIQGKTNNQTIDIYIPQKILADAVFPHNELCSFDSMCDDFGKYFRMWFDKAEELLELYHLYFRVFYHPLTNNEYLFQDLAFAIESFHRVRYGGEYQPKDEYCAGLYKRFVDSIPDETNPDFRTALEKRMKYLNQYSFRKRITQLLRRHKDSIPHRLIPNSEQFVEDVVNTRNYLVHRDEELKEKAKVGADLYGICVIVKVLLEICFLNELGMPAEKIKSVMSKSRM